MPQSLVVHQVANHGCASSCEMRGSLVLLVFRNHLGLRSRFRGGWVVALGFFLSAGDEFIHHRLRYFSQVYPASFLLKPIGSSPASAVAQAQPVAAILWRVIRHRIFRPESFNLHKSPATSVIRSFDLVCRLAPRPGFMPSLGVRTPSACHSKLSAVAGVRIVFRTSGDRRVDSRSAGSARVLSSQLRPTLHPGGGAGVDILVG